jgi:hypothetical protein
MAAKRLAKKAAAIDVKALAAEIGATVKEGKVTAVRDKYLLTVGATKKELVTGELINAVDLKKIAGKNVPVVVSGRNIVAVGYPHVPWCFILCYVPAPDIFREIQPELRATLVRRYAKQGLISKEMEQVLLTPIQLP